MRHDQPCVHSHGGEVLYNFIMGKNGANPLQSRYGDSLYIGFLADMGGKSECPLMV